MGVVQWCQYLSTVHNTWFMLNIEQQQQRTYKNAKYTGFKTKLMTLSKAVHTAILVDMPVHYFAK